MKRRKGGTVTKDGLGPRLHDMKPRAQHLPPGPPELFAGYLPIVKLKLQPLLFGKLACVHV